MNKSLVHTRLLGELAGGDRGIADLNQQIRRAEDRIHSFDTSRRDSHTHPYTHVSNARMKHLAAFALLTMRPKSPTARRPATKGCQSTGTDPNAQGGIPERASQNAEGVSDFKRLGKPKEIWACYEAGPTGYDLQRLLASIGVRCDVVAPSLIPKGSGDRVKTDRRDARRLAGLHRAGVPTPIAIPTPAQEGVRALSRTCGDMVQDLTLARNWFSGSSFPTASCGGVDHRGPNVT